MIGLALASVSVPKALAILGIVAILVASVWVCVDEYRHAPLIDLDNLTDDGPDDIDVWLSETPLFVQTVHDLRCDEAFTFAGEVESWLRRGGVA